MTKTLFCFVAFVVLAGHTLNLLAEPPSERITVDVRGKGPDVVLIPGLGCSNAVWDATAKRLEGRYRLHLIQVAGFAGAPARANAQGPVVKPTVEAIDAYIKTNQLKAPKVIGHSLGGFMGLVLAAEHPTEVGQLMVVDSLPFFSVLMGAKDPEAAKPGATMMRDTILNETQQAYEQSQDVFFRMLVKSPAGLKAATRWSAASDKAVVARAMYEIMTTDLRPQLPEIKTPVTVLHPWDPSSPVPQPTTEGIYRDAFATLPNKRMVCITNSLHFIMFDQPVAFAAQVETFLK